MKLSLLKASGIAVLVAGMFAGSALAVGIADTKHNLSSGAAGSVNEFTGGGGASELCVFCHTPHAADASAVSPPLWNRSLTGFADGNYTTYSTSTIDSDQGSITGSISIACLSCHDGSTAINTVINAPGSGLNTTWGSTGTWDAGSTGINLVAGADYGKMIGTSVAMLGVNLQNDHPISIQYGGGTAGDVAMDQLTEAAGSYLASEMKDTAFKPLNSKLIGGVMNWWADGTVGGANNIREKTDVLLYSRSDAGTTAPGNEPFVECASCHDPHSTNATFLRVVNTGSALCLACHDK